MCFPPYCHPATHVLGCFGLRQGAVGVLVINAAYGLCIVVVHALLMGEFNKVQVGAPAGGPEGGAGPGAVEAPGGAGEMAAKIAEAHHEAHERRLAQNEGVGWLIQIMDLDIGWGHELMGFDDYTNMLAGLLYGIVVIVACAYMFHAVQTGGGSLGLPTVTRWFVAFMNLELLLYIGVVLVKLPMLCKMQVEYMPNLAMECPVQKFMFLQRTVFLITLASLCIWVFSSYSFTLTFGVHGAAVMDQPEFQHHIDQRDHQITGKPPPGFGGGSMPPPSMGGSPPYQTRHSLAAGGRSLVGGAVQAPSFQSVRSQPLGPAPSAGPQRTSYNIGSMARAGSSMISSASERSHPETQSLIKPPLHVY